MNNKKKIKRNFLIGGLVILTIASILVSSVLIKKFLLEDNQNIFSLGGNYKKVENYTKSSISHLKEIDVDLPEFTVRVNGIHYGEINNINIKEKDISVYEFDGKIYNGWEVKENHYIGVRVTELLRNFGFDEYNEIIFDAVMNTATSSSTLLSKSKITDECFLIFLRDGKPLEEFEPVSFIPFDKNYRTRVENLEYITLY